MARLLVAQMVYNRLPELKEGLRTAAGLIVAKAALDVEAYAKAVVPVRTGNLKNSIRTTFPAPLTAEVGTAVEYAAYVEYGTRRMAPRPYLRPAAEAIRGEFIEAMRRVRV